MRLDSDFHIELHLEPSVYEWARGLPCGNVDGIRTSRSSVTPGCFPVFVAYRGTPFSLPPEKKYPHSRISLMVTHSWCRSKPGKMARLTHFLQELRPAFDRMRIYRLVRSEMETQLKRYALVCHDPLHCAIVVTDHQSSREVVEAYAGLAKKDWS